MLDIVEFNQYSVATNEDVGKRLKAAETEVVRLEEREKELMGEVNYWKVGWCVEFDALTIVGQGKKTSWSAIR